MRRFLVATAVILFAAASAQAVTISVQLRDLTGGTAPGIHSIGIYVQSDQGSSADDLGIAGTQIDVIAQDLGSTYGGTNSFTTTLALDGYSKISPAKVDATTANSSPAAMPGPETVLNKGNGHFDAMGLSFSTTPGGVDPTAAAIGQTSGFEFISKQAWNFTTTSVLKAFLVGPQYYDSADSGQSSDTFHNYDAATQINAINTAGSLTVTIPEPATLVLMGLGGLGMVVAARRRAA